MQQLTSTLPLGVSAVAATAPKENDGSITQARVRRGKHGDVVSFGETTLVLGDTIGEGSFGRVRLAGEQQGDKVGILAVKILRPREDAKQIALHEAAMLVKAGSALAPKYLFTDEQASHFYIAMDCVRGTLEEVLQLPILSEPRVRASLAHILLPLGGALRELHERGIAHRDIKPDNIFFTSDFRPLLGDFGLATEAHKNEGAPGTPLWMAPEVFVDLIKIQILDANSGLLLKSLEHYFPPVEPMRTDLFSLGLVLLRTLTGGNPLRRDDWTRSKTKESSVDYVDDMHVALAAARPGIKAWLDGGAFPQLRPRLWQKAAHRALPRGFVSALSKCDRADVALRTAVALVAVDPEERTQAVAYRRAAAQEHGAGLQSTLSHLMPSSVAEALRNSQVLGFRARADIARGGPSLAKRAALLEDSADGSVVDALACMPTLSYGAAKLGDTAVLQHEWASESGIGLTRPSRLEAYLRSTRR